MKLEGGFIGNITVGDTYKGFKPKYMHKCETKQPNFEMQTTLQVWFAYPKTHIEVKSNCKNDIEQIYNNQAKKQIHIGNQNMKQESSKL